MANRKLLTNNAEIILQLLLKRLKQPYNWGWNDEHLIHPYYPSFASFYYLLQRRGIECKAFRTSYEELQTLPTPIMVHLRENKGMFLLLDKVIDNQVYVINEQNRLEATPSDYFNSVWDGNVMIFNSDNIQLNPEEVVVKIKRWFSKIIRPMTIILSLLLLAGIIIQTNEARRFYSYCYLGAYSIGLMISILFLIRQFNESNSFVDKICHTKAIKKADCSSILDTQAAYFMNLFSWSDFGFIYFISLFLITLIFPIISLPITAICSLLSFPYVFYSIWYQWKIAKSWCILCLLTQGVLFILFLITLVIWPVDFKLILNYNIFYIIIIPFLIIVLYAAFKSMHSSYKELPILLQKYNELKHNDLFFDAVFEEQQLIDTTDLEKIVFNSDGKDCITVIFNPTCTPCMNKLPQLFKLLQNKKEVRLEMIYFLDPNNEKDESYDLAKNMLIAYDHSPEQFLTVVEDYATHYPMRKKQLKELFPVAEEDNERFSWYLKHHNEWCLANQIYSTPMLFFNNRKMPDIYSLTDLDYHCN